MNRFLYLNLNMSVHFIFVNHFYISLVSFILDGPNVLYKLFKRGKRWWGGETSLQALLSCGSVSRVIYYLVWSLCPSHCTEIFPYASAWFPGWFLPCSDVVLNCTELEVCIAILSVSNSCMKNSFRYRKKSYLLERILCWCEEWFRIN